LTSVKMKFWNLSGFILGIFPLAIANNCSDGWLFDGVDKCHKVLKKSATFDEAIVDCAEVNATLAIPSHSGVQDGVFRASKKVRVWLGIKRTESGTESGLRDLNGKKLTYSEWYEDQPDNFLGVEDCVEMSNAGILFWWGKFAAGWNDLSCTEKDVYPLCEMPCVGCKRKNDCSAGWTQEFNMDKNKAGDNCYKLSNDYKSWGDAECECTKSGAHLVNIENEGLNIFYEHLLRQMGSSEWAFWIGAEEETKDKWISPATGKKIKFKN